MIEANQIESKVAIIRCQGGISHTYDRFNYVGLKGCLAAEIIANGPKSCIYGCLGFGDCVSVCKFGVIHIGNNGLPIIDDKKCTGCGKCVEVCPRNIIELVPGVQKIFVACVSTESTEITGLNCKIGCIGCGECEKKCPYDAIKVEQENAKINFEFCQNCGICIYKCPTGAIADKLKSRPKAMIGVSCTGCEGCKKICPMEAIEGRANEQHKVIFEKCVGCGLCYKNCKPKSITMAFSLGYTEV